MVERSLFVFLRLIDKQWVMVERSLFVVVDYAYPLLTVPMYTYAMSC